MLRLQNMREIIEHTGIIERIDPPVVFVRIVQPSACSDCHAKSFCTGSEGKSKLIEVETAAAGFAEKEEVLLCGRYDRGIQAVWLAYIFPMLLVIAALATGIKLTGNEVTGGGIGLLVLLPYYGLIYLIRGKLKRRFVFTLSKIHY
jgi:sigma-E factor negative regulatory protein RseC